jgi:hypothetical protein
MLKFLDSPVPNLFNLFFHSNGFIPITLMIIGIIFMLFKKNMKNIGKICFTYFGICLFLAYFQLLLHLLFPATFLLVKKAFAEFYGAQYYVKSFLVHPHSIIIKISALWWFAIIVSTWLYYQLWTNLPNKSIKLFILIITIPILFADVLYMYYNKPIINKAHFSFLIELEKKIPDDAVIIAPPNNGHAWTGSLLRRDCLTWRGSGYYITNSLSKNLPSELKHAYSTGDFTKLINKLHKDTIIILLDKEHNKITAKLTSE